MTIAEHRAASGSPGGRPPSSRWKYALAGLVLLAVAIAAVAVASGSDPTAVTGAVDVDHLEVGPSVPSLNAAKGWINSPPLTKRSLAGKVVIYDFWTYSCVNCVRTLPHLRALYDRYARDGLVVVGVHSPEFDFEKDHGNVAQAVKKLGVDYPVALDDDMSIWSTFGVQYWPQKFIADRNGHVRYGDIGEGHDRQTENVVRKLLGVKASAPRARAAATGDSSGTSVQITPETYLGLERGVAGAREGTQTYPSPGTPSPGQAALVGSWTADPQFVQAAAPDAAIVLGYAAREVNLVLAPGPDAASIDVIVELDGKPLPAAYRTPDTMVGAQGETFVRVASSDLYRLALGPKIGQHTLRLTARAPGVQAFAFTFGP